MENKELLQLKDSYNRLGQMYNRLQTSRQSLKDENDRLRKQVEYLTSILNMNDI